jgi:hypothetical protein
LKAIRGPALTATTVATLLIGVPIQAAEPSEGTIRWGETVEWSGGPLNGAAINIQPAVGDLRICPDEACDDFLLNVRVPPSPNPNRKRFVQVEIDSEHPATLTLTVFPPGADPVRDFAHYLPDVVRLLDPEPGIWTIQARCTGGIVTSPCEDETYTGKATAGDFRLPRAVAHRSGGVRVTGAVSSTPTVELHQVGANAWEPTLGITNQGSIFYQGFGPRLPYVKVVRSTDEGETWENVSPRLGPFHRHSVSADPYLHVDEETGRVFTADLQPEPGDPHPGVEVSFTDDGGDTWTTTAEFDHNPDHQSLFTGPPVSNPTAGYPNVVYLCVNGYSALSTVCSKSLNGGLTFSPTGAPAYLEVGCGGLSGHGVVGRDGAVYLPRGFCGQPFLAISHDEGLTWTRVQVADNGSPNHEAAVAVDEKGNLYYTWVADDFLPYMATSTDGALTWGDPMMIGPPGVVGAALPAIDVGSPGNVAVVYIGTADNLTWNGYMMMTTKALRRDPIFLTAPVNPTSDPLTTKCDRNFEDRCEGIGDFFDVVVAPDGTPWAAFADACVMDRCLGNFAGYADGFVARLVGGPSLVETIRLPTRR